MEEKKQNSSKNVSDKKDTRGKTSLIILLLLILAIIVFTVNTVRKLNIINDLNKKFAQFENVTNYYEKATPLSSDSELISMEVYRTKDAIKNVTTSKSGKMIQITSTAAGRKEFYDTASKKTMKYSSKTELTPVVQLLNYTTEQTFWSSMFLGVSTADVDGKTCYVISNLVKPKYSDGKFKIYVDRETGLVVKTDEMKYEYQFDCVKDEDIKGPDNISEYIVLENTNNNAKPENQETTPSEGTNEVETSDVNIDETNEG